ncbi:hypothetical protein [Maribacter sp. 2-571]|uniref:hypothetical protein n=1 Tax=Maribacter sp. 2-571 TaxID=3417569 RepID=UPI003D341B0D
MNVTDFLASENLICLPTKSRPRVFLSIDDSKIAKVAFNLYNPFSPKAKFLKATLQFLCVYCNTLAKYFLPTIKTKKSSFIRFIEKALNTSLISSVYIATEKDKFVVQLQDHNGIVGYLKYPITSIGTKRLLNERSGLNILSKKNVVQKILLDDNYKGVPFIILRNLEGKIGTVSKDDYKEVLTYFKTERSFPLIDHPRVLDIKKRLLDYDQNEFVVLLNDAIVSSKKYYYVVHEHGDFAPWNLIQTKDGVKPFDFEYFEEVGLQHMDEIKYHVQVEMLLKGKTGASLIKSVSKAVGLAEFDILFIVFLLKEIGNKLEANKIYDFELSLLKSMKIEKT